MMVIGKLVKWFTLKIGRVVRGVECSPLDPLIIGHIFNNVLAFIFKMYIKSAFYHWSGQLDCPFRPVIDHLVPTDPSWVVKHTCWATFLDRHFSTVCFTGTVEKADTTFKKRTVGI